MSEVRNNEMQILIDIIKAFDPEKFIRFFRDKNRSFAPRKEELTQYNDENFKSGIKLGEIQFAQKENPSLPPFSKGGMGGFGDEKMLICLFQASQPLSERSGKKAQYEKGKKILKDSQSDAGIFIFYSLQGNFRFSLIYANYLGKKRDWSIFRRFTYFVSKEYTNKTFLQQIGEEDFSSLEKIKNAFSVEKVTKSFYTDIANWYFWAIQKTEFPREAEKEENGRNVAVIRLITRLIFIWFMKEKGLIQQNLFNHKNISTLLKDLSPKNTQYYKAILQNLFFATLNTKIEDRKFRFGKSFQGKNKDYMDHGIYRYEDYFKNKEDMLEIFKDIPFLNGGLFDCLDRRITENQRNIEMRIDGFTDKDVGLKVPNVLFFSDEINVDLNKEYGTKNKKYKVRGLIDILSSYNFTIDENDPNDADVALDPELLGKVFENLLASFNPETATTARKATGSYYTPREIVNYMVDESLTAYLSNVIDSEANIRNLISFTDKPHQFTDTEADTLIRSIDNVKILDPAVGSGAFPMGMLHKLVYILGRLDPDNSKWRELQRQKAIKDTEEAYKIGDKEERQKRLLDINEVFDDNASDYGRKLYLIENCIYGVDIQPIAVQIAKLRFFISLLVDQYINPKKENLGIRPLPNLETKFVAANTLIGIERPAQGLLRNPEIDRKEAELHRVRERHFTARTPKIKQQCIEDDKKLRAEISDLLKKDGFPAGITEKLANWNPYDQNASAGFFDPEWMYGITEGFDVVIGNPPWGAKLKAEEKELFKITYPQIDSSTPNTFAYFIGWAFENYRSVVSYVLPDSILIKDFAKTRAYIKDNISEIIWYENTGIPEEHRPFVYVDHDVCVMNIFKRKCETLKYSLCRFDRSQNQLIELKYIKDKNIIILEEFEFAFNLIAQDRDFKILKKISEFEKLDNFMQCHEGIHTGNSRDILFIEKQKNKHCRPLYYGGGAGDIIQNYVSRTSGWFVDYRAELIDKSKGYYASLRDERIFKFPKIYITRTGNPFKAFYDENTYASNNFFSLQHIDYSQNESQLLKFILPFIFSKPAQYFIRTFAAPRLGSTFIETKIYHLLKFRVPLITDKERKPIITIVDQILTAKKKDLNADTSALEKQIDEMVYALYDLTPEEIKIVEGKK